MHSWQLKFERALEHLKSVDDEVGRLLDACERGFTIEQHLEGEFLVGTIRAPREVSSDRLAALIGDCVHNLRAALDHLIAYLTVMNDGSFGTSAFPIFADGAEFTRAGARRIRQIPSEKQAQVMRLQPYQRIEVGLDPQDGCQRPGGR